ncbi:Peptidase S74 domain-containing protein [Acetobacteraceae bacterium EV16G]
MNKILHFLAVFWASSVYAQSTVTETSDHEVTFPNLSTQGAAPVLSIGGTQSDNGAPGQNTDPYTPPHALLLGGQRVGSLDASAETDQRGSGASIVIRGMPDGFMDMGCLICTVMTTYPMFQSRAGLSSNLTDVTNIADDPSYDTVTEYLQPGSAEPVLVLEDVTYDATHIYLPKDHYLTPQQIARIHQNQYVVTNSITSDVAAPEFPSDDGLVNPTSGKTLAPENYYVSLVNDVAADGSSISVQGWGVLGGNSSGHPWKANDVPTTTYDTVRNNFGKSVAMIGAPTQAGAINVYAAFNPSDNPHSMIDHLGGAEFDMHYMGTASNQASMTGLLISYDCRGAAAPSSGGCYHPTYDSSAILINGQNLPNGIQNNVSGWANEYKGYNFYIPGSKAPEKGKGNRHTSFESRTPSIDGHNLVTRAWTEQVTDADTPSWTDYRVNFGLNVDGDQWNAIPNSGSDMGFISFNYNVANLGGVCLIGSNSASRNKDFPGFCVRADGTTWFGNSLELPSGVNIEARATVNGAINIGATLSGNNQGDWVVGTQISGGASIRGVNGVYAKQYVEQLQTPASGSASCTEGQFTDDANYHYVCVGKDHWRRVALSDF